jgi:hypothetical protein
MQVLVLQLCISSEISIDFGLMMVAGSGPASSGMIARS